MQNKRPRRTKAKQEYNVQDQEKDWNSAIVEPNE